MITNTNVRKTNIRSSILFFLSLIILIVSLVQTTTFKNIIVSRGETTDITIKLALIGHEDTTTKAIYKTRVSFYIKSGKVKEYTNQLLTKDNKDIFYLKLPINDLDLSQMYAVFIKPEKYVGKIFCINNPTATDNCTTPQLVFKQGSNQLDFSSRSFSPGDVEKQDGKVDAFDLSSVLNSLGTYSPSNDIPTDINGDGIVNAYDYLLTLSSVSQNAADGAIPFPDQFIQTPTPLQPTITSESGSPTSAPTNVPSPTPAQTGKGTCNVTLNGKAYVNAGLFGNQCRILSNEKSYYCVDNQSQCNPDECIATAKSLIKTVLSQCSNNIASLDENKTQVNCQVEFIPGNCNPAPTPPCTDDRPKC